MSCDLITEAMRKVTKIVECEHCLSRYNPKNKKRADRHESRQCKPRKVRQ